MSAGGEIRVVTRGSSGPKCLGELERIQELCGDAHVVESRLTSDYGMAFDNPQTAKEDLEDWA